MDRIRVGAFEVYAADRRLCAAGKPVEIGARAFDLLLVLAESPGRLVTKATLLERVWPRLVVDENNLPTQVASLRRVLGAGAIRTVPRFGYRLDLPVTRTADPDPGSVNGASPREPDPSVAGQRPSRGPANPLVGRAADLVAIRAALTAQRLVTLVGAAGVGKSRLAREVMAGEPYGADAASAYVALEALDSIDHVPSAVALAFGLSIPDGVDRATGLGLALGSLSGLLVLDGAEHLADSLSEPLQSWIAAAPGLRILVTSQAPLGHAGEFQYRLGPLPAAEAVQLFGQRAAQADRRFELGPANIPQVEEICRKLDGNPLAVELAAARVPAFGVAALLEHLDDRFRLLKLSARAGDGRHGVLQAAFDWSYGLLSAPERHVFDRLGAFPATFSLDAAARSVADESVDMPGAMDLIGRLVDRSLITLLPQEPARYTLLETARCYARARLDASGASRDAERRMAGALLHVLERAYDDYWSADEALWLHQHEPELANVRAALEFARGHDGPLAISLYGNSWPLFAEADLHAEGRSAHLELMGHLSDALPVGRVARFWEAVATFDSERQYDRARYAAELAGGLHAKAGDARSRYYALLQLALNWRDDVDGASRTLTAARGLEQPTWPARLLAHGAIVEGALLASAGRYSDARVAYRRALEHALVASERQALAATVSIVELDIASDAIAAALQLARPLAISLRHSGRRETRHELLVLLFGALLLAGEQDEARAAGIELHELAGRLDRSKLYLALDGMALLAVRGGRPALAARIAVASEAVHASRGQVRRRPAGDRVRAAVELALDRSLGPGWRSRGAATEPVLGEEEACLMALGLRADA